MEDDIGALLDEVERKYCSSKATPTSVYKGAVSMVNPHGNHGTTTKAAYLSSASALSDDDSIADDDLERIYSEIVSDSADTSQTVCVGGWV